MNDVVNTNENIENVKTAGVWMMVLGAIYLFWALFDAWALIDALIFLSLGYLAYAKYSKSALLTGLIIYALGWIIILLLEPFNMIGLISRAYISYVLVMGYISARKLSKVSGGKQASFEYVS